jgi:pimeloyl-ACP methyl ester carboxylesterase
MPTVDANGVDLYYERSGTGPPVLIIPGIPAVVSDCRPLVDGLADAFDVIAYDNRGSGASGKPDTPYSGALLARDAAALLGVLGVGRAHVLGFSFGGMIAQHLALDSAHLVSRLVLACTHAGLAHAAAPSRDVAKAFQLRTEDWGERIRALAVHAFAPDFREREPEAYAAFVRKKSEDAQPSHAYRRQLEASVAHDTFERLPGIACPTLVITGREDRVVPAENSRVLAGRIPNARLAVVENAGHLFFVEKPAESLAAIRGFLEETPFPIDAS